jgi:hypothetical protein
MKIEQPGSHLDHMLRGTRWHHVQLSSMADMKANFLLTLSSVVITLAVPNIVKPLFQWPLLVLIAFCLITVALAAYTVMPKVSLAGKGAARPDVTHHGFNLLFFGDFVRLSYEEYESAMELAMNDPSRAYQAQVREIYNLGCFLAAKKYQVLKMAYLSFILGLFASGATLAFALLRQQG